MNKEKIRNLEKNGWKAGTVSEFLNLDREEEKEVETKFANSQLNACRTTTRKPA